MIKIAIVTEGSCEQIFTRQLLRIIFKYERISIKCISLQGKKLYDSGYYISVPTPDYYFQIMDVGGDNKVLSFIKERINRLVNKDFEVIIGLRDMWSKEYRKYSRTIDNDINNKFISSHQREISKIPDHSNRIKLYFSIMEYETWLLSMPNLFRKINNSLTVNFIEQKLGYNLQDLNPEREFFHPTRQVSDIFNLVGGNYDKSRDQMESIVSYINMNDYDDALNNDKCPSFKSYFSELDKLV